jgi:predicted permease
VNLFRRLSYYFRRARFDRELEDEMRIHLEMKAEANVASGMSPEEAEAAARREFGSRARLMESSRETWSFLLLDSLVRDVQLALRTLGTRPGFTAVALVSLALGIGANSAVFTLVNGAFLRPLPVRNPEELVSLTSATEADRRMFPTFSYPNYLDFHDRSESFEGLFAYRFAPLNVSHDGIAERMWGYLVTGNYFDVLGITPTAGRLFTSEDDRDRGGHPIAVVTYRAWRGRFGGAPDVVGKEVLINGASYTIVGVAPPGFDGTEVIVAPEVFVPLSMQAEIERGRSWLDDRATDPLFVQGRLAPGVDSARARIELDAIALSLEREFPVENEGRRVALLPAGLMTGMLRTGVLGFTGLLLAIVGFALLLMCVNLANLLLARADERRREIGMSLALGAGRVRLVRRLLMECLLLSLGGGTLGLFLAYALVRLAARWSPPGDLPLAYELQLDHRVFLFTLLASLAAGVFFALLPALKLTRVHPKDALGEAPSPESTRRFRFGNGLVLLQVALSLLLLVGSGLTIRGLRRAQTLDLGFDPDRAVEISFDLRLSGYDEPLGRELHRGLLERVRALPGVREAGIADFVPVDLHFNRSRLFPEGAPVPERPNEAPRTFVSRVSPGYLSAMRTRLLNGRDFDDSDDRDAVRVAIVNDAFVRRFWPGQDPIGKRFSLGSPESPPLAVIGVAQDGKYASLNEPPQPFAYLPLYQAYSGSTTVVARTELAPEALLASLRSEVARLDPAIPVFAARTLRQRLALPLFPARIAASFLGAFAILSLVLAAIGIYGVTSQSVTRRRREFGIRIALGARRADVFGIAMRQGLLPAMIGVVLGLALAWIATRFMTSILFGLSPQDPGTFLGTALVLVLVAALASFVPARSASARAPVHALRSE